VTHCPAGTPARAALTLAELVVVLALLVVLGGLVMPALGRLVGDSRGDTTRLSLARLAEAVETYWQDNTGAWTAPRLCDLFLNPATGDASVSFDPLYRRGWRGPYVLDRASGRFHVDAMRGFDSQYGAENDPAPLDAWSNPIVVQSLGRQPDGRWDLRLVSAGPDGVLQTPSATATAALTTADTGDDLVLSVPLR